MRRPTSTAADATDALARATSVSERTRLAAANARGTTCPSNPATVPARPARSYASLTCPRICGSPTTAESRLEATRNRCRIACSSECAYMYPSSTAPSTRRSSAMNSTSRARACATSGSAPGPARYSSTRLHVDTTIASPRAPVSDHTIAARRQVASISPSSKATFSRISTGAEWCDSPST